MYGLIEIYGPLKEGDILLRSGSDEIKNGTMLKNVKNIPIT
jgi:hypothetical protein